MPDKLGAEYSCSLCSSLLQPRLFATSETRRGLVAKFVPQLFPESLPGTRRSTIRYFHISHNAPYLPPAPCPKFYITYVFHFSWLLQPSQEEIDHIFTNKPNIITNHGVLHVGISDHSLIYATHKHIET